MASSDLARRQRDIANLLSVVDPEVERAAEAFFEITHSEDSVHRQSVNDAALDALGNLTDLAAAARNATEALAVALMERGVSPTEVAKRAGVSRVTAHAWRNKATHSS